MATTTAELRSLFDSKIPTTVVPVQGPWQPENELDELSIELGAIDSAVTTFGRTVGRAASTIGGWFVRAKIPAAYQAEVRALQEEFDTVDQSADECLEVITGAEGKVIRRKPRRSNANWWMRYSVMARGKFLDPSKTASQRRSIHKWIYEHMEADKVTKLDIARVIGRATEWVYHAEPSEVKAVMDRNSPAMVERERDHEAPWWSYWWGVSRRSVGKD